MNSQKDGGRNVSDYETIKSVLFAEYYDLLRLVNSMNSPKMKEGTKNYDKTVSLIENRLFFLANMGGSSRNISEELVQEILGVEKDENIENKKRLAPNLKELKANKSKLQDYLTVITTRLSMDMGRQGFLDTRLDEDQTVDNSGEEIPDMFVKN